MMKPKKIGIPLLSAVLTLSLILSLITGLSLTAAGDEPWDYEIAIERKLNADTYAGDRIIPNTSFDNFRVYSWESSKDAADAYDYKSYTLGENAAAANGGKLRQQFSSTHDYRSAGYIDLKSADTGKPYALTLTGGSTPSAAAVTEFEAEVSFVMSAATQREAQKSIMIAPAGEFAITNDEVADTGLLISMLPSGGKLAIVVAGAIDPTHATQTIGSMNPEMRYAKQQQWFINAAAKTATGSTLSTVPTDLAVKGETAGLITLHVEVSDGQLYVWDVAAPDKRVIVPLSASYAGGNISWVSTSQYRGAFAGMKVRKLTPSTEWSYTVERNMNEDVTYYPENAAIQALENDFRVYQWDTLDTAGSAAGLNAVTLKTGYPKAADTNTLGQVAGETKDARSGGYLSFDGGFYDGKMQAAMTHNQVVKDFYLEVDQLITSTMNPCTRGIMIAPAGEYALSADGTTDKGIYISYSKDFQYLVAGAIKPETGNLTGNNSQLYTGVLGQAPVKFTANKIGGNNGGCSRGEDITVKGGTGSVETICIEVRNGMLSIWSKDNQNIIMTVELSDKYVGGNVSYVANSSYAGGLAGFRLKKLNAMGAGEVSINEQTGLITMTKPVDAEYDWARIKATDSEGNALSMKRVGFRKNGATSVWQALDANGNVVKTGVQCTPAFIEPSYTNSSEYTVNMDVYGISQNASTKGVRFNARIARVVESDVEYVKFGDIKYKLLDYGMTYKVDGYRDNTFSHKDASPIYDKCAEYVEIVTTVTELFGAFKDDGINIANLADAKIQVSAYIQIEVDGQPVTLKSAVYTQSYNSLVG